MISSTTSSPPRDRCTHQLPCSSSCKRPHASLAFLPETVARSVRTAPSAPRRRRRHRRWGRRPLLRRRCSATPRGVERLWRTKREQRGARAGTCPRSTRTIRRSSASGSSEIPSTRGTPSTPPACGALDESNAVEHFPGGFLSFSPRDLSMNQLLAVSERSSWRLRWVPTERTYCSEVLYKSTRKPHWATEGMAAVRQTLERAVSLKARPALLACLLCQSRSARELPALASALPRCTWSTSRRGRSSPATGLP